MADKPSHNVYVVDGEGKKAYWTKVGGAWKLKEKDGFSVVINQGLAVHGRLVIIAAQQDERDEG